MIDGALALKELHLNDLYFTNINGSYHYENALITFQDVTGSIFGGTFDAIGLYHFDNRYYKIDVDGKNLMASLAAKSRKINTSVDLKISSAMRDRMAIIWYTAAFLRAREHICWCRF